MSRNVTVQIVPFNQKEPLKEPSLANLAWSTKLREAYCISHGIEPKMDRTIIKKITRQ